MPKTPPRLPDLFAWLKEAEDAAKGAEPVPVGYPCRVLISPDYYGPGRHAMKTATVVAQPYKGKGDYRMRPYPSGADFAAPRSLIEPYPEDLARPWLEAE